MGQRRAVRIGWAVLAAMMICAAPLVAQAEGVATSPTSGHALQWDPVTKYPDGKPVTDMKDYLVYLAPTSSGYDFSKPAWVTVAHPTGAVSITATAKPLEGQNYAVVKSRDLSLNTSGPSNEVAFTYDSQGPPAPVVKIVIAAWDESERELTMSVEEFLGWIARAG